MNTHEESLAYVEGVVDVTILLPSCLENPLKELAINFLAEVLAQKSRAVIPVTFIIGAYHIATRHPEIPELAVKKVLEGILRTKSPALCSSRPGAPPSLGSVDFSRVRAGIRLLVLQLPTYQ